MTKEDFFKFHAKMCLEMLDISRKKNADYTGNNQDPFANFTGIKNCGGASTEQGFLFRMNDKISRVSSFVEKGELLVKDETVEDTLLDLANYCILFKGYLESEKKRKGGD